MRLEAAFRDRVAGYESCRRSLRLAEVPDHGVIVWKTLLQTCDSGDSSLESRFIINYQQSRS